MPQPNTPSPAVSSLHEEQARQRTAPSELDEGLDETFPASDPVSMTSTTTAGTPGEKEEQAEKDPAPKVDEALAAVRQRSRAGSRSTDFASDEIRAMRAEVDGMLGSANEVARASGRVTRHKVRSLRKTVSDQVRKHPIQALSLATIVGFIWGMTR